MSMLVRKGTMLHRNITRRHNRRKSIAAGAVAAAAAGAASVDRARSGSVAIGPASTSAFSGTTTGIQPPPRRYPAPAVPGTTAFTASGIRPTPGIRLETIPLHPTSSPADSRRSSSVTGRLSADDRKALFSSARRQRGDSESAGSGRHYASLSYQLKDANRESTGCCDFLGRALDILSKTVAVTIFFLCLGVLALFMVIFGVQYLHSCPVEPRLPLYLLLGGGFGLLKSACLLYRQNKWRRYERLDDDADLFALSGYDDEVGSGLASASSSQRVTQTALSLFLVAWFAAGNYWTWPLLPGGRPTPPPLEPRNWCHRALFTFTITHLCLCYSAAAAFLLLVLLLVVTRRFGCL